MRSDVLANRGTTRHRRAGPIRQHIEAFAEQLTGLGYVPSTIGEHVRLLRRLDQWMHRRHLSAVDLDARVVGAFLNTPRSRRHTRRHGGASLLGRFLEYLRAVGATPAATPVIDQSPRAQLERTYREYLQAQCGLCVTTIETYVGFFRRFLTESLSETGSVGTLTASDVSAFVRRHARDRGSATAKMMVTALRAMFRFLFQTGDLTVDLGVAVPTIRDWRLATIPKAMAPDDVERLLRACNLETGTGRRDHAVLLLLARLGLRAGEVVALELDDINWRAGEIVIRGKKSLRQDRFPLPVDVGQALATYLYRHRPPSASRRVFLCMRAPRRAFATRSAVTTIVRRAVARAGLEPPVRGAHLLRHSLATRMLGHGASLGEIGEVLRHRAVQTTEIYAKVDLASLRAVVQPWPETGGAQ
jgi:site-specific recombinase XerD